MSEVQRSIDLVRPSVATGEASSGPVRTIKKKPAPPPRTELQLLNDIDAKLDRIVAVLAAAQAKDRDQQVKILAAAGCDSAFVGAFVNLAASRVRQLDSWRQGHGNGGEGEE